MRFGIPAGLAIAVVASMVSGFSVVPALAQAQPLDGYCALIADHDKVSSDGVKLTDAASILRQDRANMHRFGTADVDDGSDDTFTTSKAREAIPEMFKNGNVPASVANEIVKGNPFVCVEIQGNSLDVFVAERENLPPEGYFEVAEHSFTGTWDCGAFNAEIWGMSYGNGDGYKHILEVQDLGADGTALIFGDEDFVIISGETDTDMDLYASATGDTVSCVMQP